ncbi:MAG: hydroxyacylglutathione hydrolase [Alphaproteobacteria bacterium]|nr:hydroxyacylglutathione hydrolase [Alphaproteobacteria bacterium]MDE2011414.1 hydroxyacylglutathione hydrolase [Alphaproteobacteria bacterium]MDE2071805.1 hydroxyacylglutathione hydrolase [Alphaproteobacteria bacterium]MDE2350411.1 hydroxyacylglutathione hydrolase [Alphaproteobacteria bacterium]
MPTLSIELVPCLSDNYAYLVTDPAQKLCAVVDPSEAGPVREKLRAGNVKLTHILNTHHHPDHTGGNLALKEEFGAIIVGPEKDRARIPGLDVGVSEKAPWQFGSKKVSVLEIPAHTSGHIAFVFAEDKAAFTGDTLFAMGCGRLFEGTAAMMWAAMQKLMALPDDTAVYCGHEYTLSNGRFALTLEPGNADLQARMREVEELRAKGLPTIPTTIGLEKRTNPFMRPNAPELRATLGMEKAHDVDVLAETRRRKDNF